MNVNDISNSTGKLALEFCKAKFGPSKYHNSFPKLRIMSNTYCSEDPSWGGYFKPDINQIVVYKLMHSSFVDFMNTIIHEYIHYLQDLRDDEVTPSDPKYNDDPLEVEAQYYADQYQYECKQFVTKQLKRGNIHIASPRPTRKRTRFHSGRRS